MAIKLEGLWWHQLLNVSNSDLSHWPRINESKYKNKNKKKKPERFSVNWIDISQADFDSAEWKFISIRFGVRKYFNGQVMSHASFHWWLSRQFLNSYSVLSLMINTNECYSTLGFSYKIRFSHACFRAVQILRHAALLSVLPFFKLRVNEEYKEPG
jgi:hypothetical protein